MLRALQISLAALTLAAVVSTPALGQRRTAPRAAPQTPAAAPFTTTLTLKDMTGKQAVVNTTAGTFVIDLRPDLAPNHVGYFINLVREGGFNGTTFHRVIRLGIIQGGDPLSKDPAKVQLYGTGGLGRLKAELSTERATRGAVAAVLQPNRPDSAGAQFFVCVTDQPALDGKYTVFGRVAEGMDVVQKISEAPASADGRPGERIEILSAAIRDTPPPEPEPFSIETPAELAGYRPGSTPRGARLPSSSSRRKRRSTCGTSCALRRRACSTARRSTGSSPGSSSRPGRSTAADR